MKKVLLSISTLGVIAMLGVLNFTSFASNKNLQVEAELTFTNYNSQTSGVAGNLGYDTAFDNNGDIAYAGRFNGLSVGIRTANSTAYTFKNYSFALETPGITDDFGTGVAFNNLGDVAYTSLGGGLSIGTPTSDGYNFTNYKNEEETDLGSDNGYDVAFDSLDNVAYCSENGGLSIGKYDSSDASYTFTNYNSSTTGIASNVGHGVAFDSNGDIAYAASGGGFSVGKVDGNGYDFTNFNLSTPNITSLEGRDVAFNSDNDVAYASLGGGVSIGKVNGDSYTFTNYSTSENTPGINSDGAEGVDFSRNGTLGYVADGNGLSVGKINNAGLYSFTNYNQTNTDNLGVNNGYGVAIDNFGDIGYASLGGGLSIGIINNPIATINSQDFIYDTRSNDNNLNIANLPFSFSFPLRSLEVNQYIQLIIRNSNNDNLVGIYLTSNGDEPSDLPSISENIFYSFHSDDSTTYEAANITNSGAGFAEGVTYNIVSNLFNSDGSEESIGEETFFTIPDEGSLPNVDFDAFDLNFIETGEATNIYTISNLALNFSYPLINLTTGEYIYTTIANAQGLDLVSLYLTSSGDDPQDGGKASENRVIKFHSDASTKYVFDNLNNSNNGFAAGNSFNLNVFVVKESDGEQSEIYNSSFETPADNVNPINPDNPSNPTNSDRSVSTGAVVGGIVGGLGFLAFLVGDGIGIYF